MLSKRGSEDPSNHPDAMRRDRPGWTVAETSEVGNHAKLGSFRFKTGRVPRGRRLVKLTWAYKTKRDGRKKARLCVQGCTQIAGVDYDQTFCAAMRSGSLRLLCAIAGRLKLHMRRFDFVAAYLQGDLEPGEVVYTAPCRRAGPPPSSTA